MTQSPHEPWQPVQPATPEETSGMSYSDTPASGHEPGFQASPPAYDPAASGFPVPPPPYGQPSPYGQPGMPQQGQPGVPAYGQQSSPYGQPPQFGHQSGSPYGQPQAAPYSPYAEQGVSPYAQPQAAYGQTYPGMQLANPQAPYGIDPVTGLPFSDKSKIIAGVLQLLLGGLGIGRFYMGYTTVGILQIVVTLITLGFGALWGFIDGIVILVGQPKDAQGRPLRS